MPAHSSSRSAVLGLALAAAFALSLSAHAQAPAGAPVKSAVIDTERVLLESTIGKKAVAELKALQEAKEKELGGLQQEIKDLQARADAGRASLPADQLAALDRQREDKVITLRRLQDDANRELTARRDASFGAVDQQVMPIIRQLGKELGYGMIFRKFDSGLIYVDDAFDLTTQVIQRLDAATAKPGG